MALPSGGYCKIPLLNPQLKKKSLYKIMFSVSNLVLLANVLSLKRLLHIILSEKKEGLEEAWWNYKSIDLNSFKILPSVIIL